MAELSFIESRLDIGQEQAVPLIAQTNKYIETHFSDRFIKIYDSPPGTSCPVIEAVKDSDFVILVTEPTPFGLHDLKLAVDTVRELNKNLVSLSIVTVSEMMKYLIIAKKRIFPFWLKFTMTAV